MPRGQTLSLVGESGCGKSTTGKCLIRLTDPTEGRILLEGQDLAAMNGEQLRAMRRRMQFIFQDPFSSMNPRMRVRDIIGEPLRNFGHGRAAIRERVAELLARVSLRPDAAERYPHEFSGGQRQRIVIARALALEPALIVCDEPVSALDVSVQAQVINLLMDLQRDLGLTYVFISHDLRRGAPHQPSRRRHVPGQDRRDRSARRRLQPAGASVHARADGLGAVGAPGRTPARAGAQGEIPSPLSPPSGCAFRTRCPQAAPLRRRNAGAARDRAWPAGGLSFRLNPHPHHISPFPPEPAMPDTQPYDYILAGGTVIDGSNTPGVKADVGVRGDRVAAVGDLSGAAARERVDVSGLVVAPGFIDSHTHDDNYLLRRRDMTPKISQGVTTVITGNCGISLAPLAHPAPPAPLDLLDEGGSYKFTRFADYLDALRATPAAVNAACMVGHSTLRAAVMPDLHRPATPAEIDAMRALAEEAMASGAIGVSTGTFYPPAAHATTEEIIEVCRPLATHGGIYATHMRDEGEHIVPALEETFRIGRELDVPVVISHHKLAGQPNFGRSRETLALIERAMAAQDVSLDAYPYVAGSTMLKKDRVLLAGRVVITWCKPFPELTGRELDEVAAERGKSKYDVVDELQPAGAIYFMMDEGDVQRILSFPPTMIGSDGLPHDERPHPRLWGTFPRVLGHYSRDLGLFRWRPPSGK